MQCLKVIFFFGSCQGLCVLFPPWRPSLVRRQLEAGYLVATGVVAEENKSAVASKCWHPLALEECCFLRAVQFAVIPPGILFVELN